MMDIASGCTTVTWVSGGERSQKAWGWEGKAFLLISLGCFWASHPLLDLPVSPFPPTLPHNGSVFLPKLPVHLAGDAFSEEANKRFERYPGQTSNQII